MPELPEVECVRRSIEARALGLRVQHATVHRRDALCRLGEPRGGWSRLGGTPRPTRFTRIPKHELGEGATIAAVHRHGKQLAVELTPSGALLVHLGMTGQLLYRPPGARLPKTDHVHATWRLVDDRGEPAGRLVFRDPRRFGGVWLYPTIDRLREDRWRALGPDGLALTTPALKATLARTERPIKGALLDQSVVAGVGNIYADESLFRARIHPEHRASALPPSRVDKLRIAITGVLREALDAGGSTLRDYTDGDGATGTAQAAHRVYGRGGMPCLHCRHTLDQAILAQRTTVWCPACQPR